MYTVEKNGLTASVSDGKWKGNKYLIRLGKLLESTKGVSEFIWPDKDYGRAKLLSDYIEGDVEGEPQPRKVSEGEVL